MQEIAHRERADAFHKDQHIAAAVAVGVDRHHDTSGMAIVPDLPEIAVAVKPCGADNLERLVARKIIRRIKLPNVDFIGTAGEILDGVALPCVHFAVRLHAEHKAVVAGPAEQHISPQVAAQHIVVLHAQQAVSAVASNKPVAAIKAFDGVIALKTRQLVVASVPPDSNVKLLSRGSRYANSVSLVMTFRFANTILPSVVRLISRSAARTSKSIRSPTVLPLASYRGPIIVLIDEPSTSQATKKPPSGRPTTVGSVLKMAETVIATVISIKPVSSQTTASMLSPPTV